ncbi:MAG TPA: 2-amino-4-hydroxy-6-hydroxymethyldihydropteridine diphosphokinase [Kofleriaceae bacterium]|nr:2-amino-4-hydroxy-6-hydroxymethyldihydropteridine diphosphokinase [Kofleriaceae bacterium]
MTPGSDRVYVALGGNIGTQAEILARFDDACERLRIWAAAGGELARSPVYRSAPAGPVPEQPLFLNQVAGFAPASGLEPRALLDLLHAIEDHHGRRRDVPQGPRTLDLDILVFGQRVIALPDLIVPHPRLGHRSFVLAPLLDLVAAEHPVEKL